MEEQLREQVARGVAWSMAEKIGSMLSMTAVRLVIDGADMRDMEVGEWPRK